MAAVGLQILSTWLMFEMETIKTMVYSINSQQTMKFPSLSKGVPLPVSVNMPPTFEMAIVKTMVHRHNTAQNMKLLSLNESMLSPVSKSMPLTFEKATIRTMVHQDNAHKCPLLTSTTHVLVRV
jgi:hypothetical protein